MRNDAAAMQDGILAYHLMCASLAQFKCRFDQLPPAQRPQIEQTASRSLQIETLVLKSPEAADVHVLPEMLERAFGNLAARYPSKDEFVADLNQNGLDEPTLHTALQRELKADAVMEKVCSAVPQVREDEVRQWYEAHPAKFELEETRTARHILITINDSFEENKREKALERMLGVKDTLDGTQTGFHAAASHHSECPTALEGGVLGRLPRGKLYPELDDALFELGAGEISDIVESEIGFHILFCEEIFPAQTVSYEEAAPKIRTAMEQKRKLHFQKNWVASLLNHSATEA